MAPPRDRAATAANAITLVVRTHLQRNKAASLRAMSTADRAALHAEITGILREEFHEVRAQARDDLNLSDG
jgi:hypothetical protein